MIALQITFVEIPKEMKTNTAMSTITNKSTTKTNTGKASLSSFGSGFHLCQKRVCVSSGVPDTEKQMKHCFDFYFIVL